MFYAESVSEVIEMGVKKRIGGKATYIRNDGSYKGQNVAKVSLENLIEEIQTPKTKNQAPVDTERVRE